MVNSNNADLRFRTLVQSSQTVEESRLSAARQDFNRPWLSLEGLQQVLQGYTLELCKRLDLSQQKCDQLLNLVRQLWFYYLKARLLCFAKKSNPINSINRDKPMYRAIKTDGFCGFEKKCYDPEVFKKSDFGADEGQ